MYEVRERALRPKRDPSVIPARPVATAAALRVVVVDAHPITRTGICAILEEHGGLRPIAQTDSAVEARQLVGSTHPDIVVLGVSLTDGDGIELCQELRLRSSTIGIVILSATPDGGELLRALDAGASAFVSKCASPQELASAVRHSAAAPGSFTASGLADALTARHCAVRRPLLSDRETEVLRLFQQGRSIPEVAGTLFVGMSTAKTYVARLYDKLGATNRAQALMAAVRLGLLTEAVEPRNADSPVLTRFEAVSIDPWVLAHRSGRG